MPINFPTTPTLAQSYTFGNKTWSWNGTGWVLSGPAPTALLQNKHTLRDFYKTLYAFQLAPATTRFAIACYGDSVSPHIASAFIRSLAQSYPVAAMCFPAFGEFLPGANPVLSGSFVDSGALLSNQAVYDGTGGFADFTYLPSGRHVTLNNAAVLLADAGQSTGYSQARVFLARGPGMGSALVELLDEFSAVLQTQNVALTGATLDAVKVAFTGLLTNGKYKVRVTATGKVVHLLTVLLRDAGIVPLNFGRGNSTLAQNNYASQTILQFITADLGLSLVFCQAKEENAVVSVPAAMAVLGGLAASVIVTGSLPDNGNEANQLASNAIFRTSALASGFAYADGYNVFGSYAELVRLGWQGDGVHPIDPANQYVAGLLIGELGTALFLGGQERRSVNHLHNDTLAYSYVLSYRFAVPYGNDEQLSVDVIEPYGGGQPDAARIKNVRQLVFGAPGTKGALNPWGIDGVQVVNAAGADGVIRVGTVESTGPGYFDGALRGATLELTGATLPLSATAGTSGAVPAQVSKYLTVVINATTYKIPLYL